MTFQLSSIFFSLFMRLFLLRTKKKKTRNECVFYYLFNCIFTQKHKGLMSLCLILNLNTTLKFPHLLHQYQTVNTKFPKLDGQLEECQGHCHLQVHIAKQNNFFCSECRSQCKSFQHYPKNNLKLCCYCSTSRCSYVKTSPYIDYK